MNEFDTELTAIIQRADALLPGEAAPEGAVDPRWQAILSVGDYIETEPEPVWNFARRWAETDDEDRHDAIATILLEHLLEYHFERFFPEMEVAVRASPRFARCFSRCWPFGKTKQDGNLVRFEALRATAKA